jgi:hypothetical protein
MCRFDVEPIRFAPPPTLTNATHQALPDCPLRRIVC